MIDTLKELGLTQNEARVYMHLMTRGPLTTTPLIKELKISTSQIYYTLGGLTAKGLVSAIEKNKVKVFAALNVIDKYLEKKYETAKEVVNTFEKTAIRTPLVVTQYEGFDAFTQAFFQMVDECKSHTTMKIIGFSDNQYAAQNLWTVLLNVNIRAKEKGITLHILLGKGGKNIEKRYEKQESFVYIRHLPESFESQTAVNIVNNKVYLSEWSEKPVIVCIQGERFKKSFEQYFDWLWKQSKKR
jgi:HTH-type transcriptional regulator, sugar sensing transcriptional regulator